MGTNGWRAKLRLRFVSPVHIGTGERLDRPKLFYDIRNGKICRLDVESFLRNPDVPVHEKERYFSDTLKAEAHQSIKGRMNSLYHLFPASGRRMGKEIRETMKLSQSLPYIPGSSVKGAIRTAFAWNLYYHRYYIEKRDKNEVLRPAGNQRRDQFKATELEKFLFREGPQLDAKEDALKGLFVSDSEPINEMELRLYDLVTRKGGQATIDSRGPFALEAIKTGSVVDIPIKVDGYFLQPDGDYKPSENASAILIRPESFVGAIKQFGKKVAEEDREYYNSIGMRDVAKFFEQDDLMPIGFGTGWNAKTIGTFLNQEDIRTAKITFRYGHPPPISRRVAIDKDNNHVLPIGWVQFAVVM